MSKNNKKNEDDYTKRADGYGSGGSESNDDELPYEKARDKIKKEAPKAPTKDENVLPNQHGEVDQYSFRGN